MHRNLIMRRLFKGAMACVLFGALGAVTYIRATAEPPVIMSIEDIERQDGKAVTASSPQEMDFADYIRSDATIRGPKRFTLRSSISERVDEVSVDVGDTVGENELLVEFRKDDIESDIDAARVRYEEAGKNYERFMSLLERGVVSDDAVEARRTAMQDARSALQKSMSRLEFTEVRAPRRDELDYEGGKVQVSARDVDPGEFKSAGQPLVVLTDMSVMDVEAQIPQNAVQYLEKGSTIEFRLEHEQQWREARIERLSPTTDDPHRFFTVYARTDNEKPGAGWLLRPGMYAEVRALREGRPNSMAVPNNALRVSEGGCCSVFVVEPGDKNPDGTFGGVVSELELETGLRSKNWVEVRSPTLNGNEMIVLNPRIDLEDGDRVLVVK